MEYKNMRTWMRLVKDLTDLAKEDQDFINLTRSYLDDIEDSLDEIPALTIADCEYVWTVGTRTSATKWHRLNGSLRYTACGMYLPVIELAEDVDPLDYDMIDVCDVAPPSNMSQCINCKRSDG